MILANTKSIDTRVFSETDDTYFGRMQFAARNGRRAVFQTLNETYRHLISAVLIASPEGPYIC